MKRRRIVAIASGCNRRSEVTTPRRSRHGKAVACPEKAHRPNNPASLFCCNESSEERPPRTQPPHLDPVRNRSRSLRTEDLKSHQWCPARFLATTPDGGALLNVPTPGRGKGVWVEETRHAAACGWADCPVRLPGWRAGSCDPVSERLERDPADEMVTTRELVCASPRTALALSVQTVHNTMWSCPTLCNHDSTDRQEGQKGAHPGVA